MQRQGGDVTSVMRLSLLAALIQIFVLFGVQGLALSSNAARSDAQMVLLAREAFFAYTSPLSNGSDSTNHVLYVDDQFVTDAFQGVLRLTVHNVTYKTKISLPKSAYVAINATFGMYQTAAKVGVREWEYEQTFDLPESKLPGIDGGPVIVTVERNNAEAIATALGLQDILPDRSKTLGSATLNVAALGLTAGVASTLAVPAGDAVITLSLLLDKTLPIAQPKAVETWENAAAWTALAERARGPHDLTNLTRVAFVNSNDTDTEVWISRNVDTKQVVVSFRGSDQIADFTTSTLFNLVPFLPQDLNKTDLNTTATLHLGYLNAWRSVERQVLAIVEACTGAEPASWHVTLTGHSLGAAEATIAAYYIATYKGGLYNSTTMYNYGSPRVGNSQFVQLYTSTVPDSWRIFNADDPIVKLPPRLKDADDSFSIPADYHHTFPGVNMSAAGNLTVYPPGTVEPYEDMSAVLAFVSAIAETNGSNVTEAPYFTPHREVAYQAALTSLVNSGGSPDSAVDDGGSNPTTTPESPKITGASPPATASDATRLMPALWSVIVFVTAYRFV